MKTEPELATDVTCNILAHDLNAIEGIITKPSKQSPHGSSDSNEDVEGIGFEIKTKLHYPTRHELGCATYVGTASGKC